MTSDDRSEQRAASDEAARRLREDPMLVEPLNRLLREGPPRARFAAAWALFHGGRTTLRLLPALLDALELDDGDLRWAATHLLTALGRLQGEVLPVLLHEARSATSARRRRMGLYALRELAPERPETEICFVRALEDGDPEVRRAALTSLAKLREPTYATARRAVSILAGESDPDMQRIAAVLVPALAAQHPATLPEARAALERAARGGDATLARVASAALARLDA